jgi:hypothetical protein
MLLAVAQRTDALPESRNLTSHCDPKTAADVLAAIEAIEKKNQDYFVDRKHTGKMHLNVVHFQ